MTALYSIIGDVTNVFGLSYVNTYYDNVTNSNSFAADADSYQIQAGDAPSSRVVIPLLRTRLPLTQRI